MGIQDKEDVALIRHAYTVTVSQRKGAGTMLLRHVVTLTGKPLLIGTWADASWAIDFYKRNGFEVVSDHDKNLLLGEYWAIPTRQVETSVVLVDSHWLKAKG
jgi:GNAT superfamily N-acetyltransferase